MAAARRPAAPVAVRIRGYRNIAAVDWPARRKGAGNCAARDSAPRPSRRRPDRCSRRQPARVAARPARSGAAAAAETADLGGAGERHGGVEHAISLDHRIQRGGVGLRQTHTAMGRGRAEAAFGVRAVDGVADLGEEDRVRHRRVIEFLGEVVFLHAEGAEAAVRRLARWNAGRNRPLIAHGAVDRDGHQLRILVDGDVDFGLRGAGGEQHQAGDSNEEGTHFTLGLQVTLGLQAFTATS